MFSSLTVALKQPFTYDACKTRKDYVLLWDYVKDIRIVFPLFSDSNSQRWQRENTTPYRCGLFFYAHCSILIGFNAVTLSSKVPSLPPFYRWAVPYGGQLYFLDARWSPNTSTPPSILTVTNGRKSDGGHDREIMKPLCRHDLALSLLLNR